MADDDKSQKTEPATPRRRQEAREKGQVPISLELVAAFLLCGWIGALATAGSGLARAVGGGLADALRRLGELGRDELSIPSAAALLSDAALSAGGALIVLVLPLMLVGGLVGYVQVGFQVTPKAVEADLAKLDPIKGLGRLFSARSVVRTGMALGKLALIAGTMVGVAWTQLDAIVALAGSDVGPMIAGIGHVALRCVAGALLAVVLLAVADAAYQRWEHERELRMSKQEIREEHRNLEGDPHVKARIRRVQREMAARRQMAEVPKATVVVTNPTHYAVALRYERDDGAGAGRGAPRVVAKGVDHVAQKIKQVAREAGVLCFEDVPLARALHARCELGDEVPVDLYQAVAEVLAYVYRVQGAQAAPQGA